MDNYMEEKKYSRTKLTLVIVFLSIVVVTITLAIIYGKSPWYEYGGSTGNYSDETYLVGGVMEIKIINGEDYRLEENVSMNAGEFVIEVIEEEGCYVGNDMGKPLSEDREIIERFVFNETKTVEIDLSDYEDGTYYIYYYAASGSKCSTNEKIYKRIYIWQYIVNEFSKNFGNGAAIY